MTAPGTPAGTGAPTADLPTGPRAAVPSVAMVTAALQGALQAEHRAVFGYAALGPHLAAADVATARADEAAHRSLRDRTSAALTLAGTHPQPSAASYAVPGLTSARRAVTFALDLEDGAASAWRFVLAEAALRPATPAMAAMRASALTALTASAVRAMRWRARLDPVRPTVAFPGD